MSKRLSKSLFTATLCASILTGCGHYAPPSVIEPPPANLRQPCADLAMPANGSAKAVLRWSVDTAEAYRICQNRHRELVYAWPK